ncbi:uncharacterized protein CBL_00923 [Carabus blaptoides fortunei]
MCQHIEAAVKCTNEASSLELKNSVLELLNVSDDMKQEIYQLASQTTAPLVQRVSKNIMAVKCQVSPKHPLGYLHFSFFTPRAKERSESKFYCSCVTFKGQTKTNGIGQCKNEPAPIANRKCVHFYACICAFASDSKLAEEFACHVNMEQTFKMSLLSDNDGLSGLTDNQFVSILENDLIDPRDVCDIEVEVLNENALLGVTNICQTMSDVMEPNVQVQNLEINENGEVTIIRGIPDDALHFSDLPDNLQCFSDTIDLTTPLEIIPLKKAKLDSCPKPVKLKASKKVPQQSAVQTASTVRDTGRQKKMPTNQQDTTTLEEKRTQISFVQWLATVTERINQTMHYQFNGKPDALIFHVPQVFFDCLRERISFGGSKKRLPNYTSAFIRKDAIPIGTFTKYTWHITNILHVKQIFETPLIPLQITKSFVQNRDGTYDHYTPRGDEKNDTKRDGLIPIRPLELKTYLKVGNTSHNQVEPTPFIIEWIPDILPLSKIGELRIKFEFGHQKEVSGAKPIRILKKNLESTTCVGKNEF